MWNMINSLPSWGSLPTWGLGLSIVPLALVAVIAAFGGGKVVEVGAKVAGSLWDGVVWTFSNIFAPGAKNIVENGASVITCLAVGAVLWIAADARNLKTENWLKNELTGYKATLEKTRTEVKSCQIELKKLGAAAKRLGK